MFMNIISVALGGGFGAVCRYLCGFIPAPYFSGFPVITLLINFFGALIIGILAGILDNSMLVNFNINERVMLFLKVGFCGGFTTFSTFSLEMFNLIDDNKVFLAVMYAVISVVLCLLGVLIGKYLSKVFFVK